VFRKNRGNFMKKPIITLIALVLLGIGIYLIIRLFITRPPEPIITVEGKNVPWVQGSYCWEGLLNSICTDMPSPPELIKNQELKPLAVSPYSKLKIEFNKEPKENTLTVSSWISNKDSKTVLLSDNVILVPKEKGVYVYSFSAGWEKGGSGYAFTIEVQ
jgi:hypothetical protein